MLLGNGIVPELGTFDGDTLGLPLGCPLGLVLDTARLILGDTLGVVLGFVQYLAYQ